METAVTPLGSPSGLGVQPVVGMLVVLVEEL